MWAFQGVAQFTSTVQRVTRGAESQTDEITRWGCWTVVENVGKGAAPLLPRASKPDVGIQGFESGCI